MNVPLKSLRCFLTLAEMGNYTRAAEKLFLTQPTLTKLIQRLEESLGEPLLVRNNQRVALTPAGVLLVDSATQMLGQWHRLQEELTNRRGLKSGQLRLGICPMMSSLTIDLLTEFRRRYPAIQLEMSEYGGYGCEQALLKDALDIAFTALPTSHDEFLSQPLKEYPLLACIPTDHPLNSKSSLCWQDFADHPFIMYNEDFSLAKLLTRLSLQAGVNLNVAFRSGQWDFIASMVESNMGLAILPEPICAQLPGRKLAFKPICGETTWNLALIWREQLALTPAAKALLALAQEMYSQPQALN
ncbi:LysR family transcriptional regulator [Shewanella sp. SNU WT4]|uniref:LysR family transcriptional regulator n=1 Tax=Shewanella sp. SNU WT4 TaxID=2590015 RepID=UPI00112C8E43|nr:LysR family transcriptional regulator [Shewanella sp. SNU WT4]QDF68221.1 LysR family transcriptional regulator [Shewanella sp. SNU WT4]